MNLPEPAHEFGYTEDQIHQICKERNIFIDDFWDKFGVNTCALDEKLGRIYYPCDVQRALWNLNKPGGKYIPFD